MVVGSYVFFIFDINIEVYILSFCWWLFCDYEEVSLGMNLIFGEGKVKRIVDK